MKNLIILLCMVLNIAANAQVSRWKKISSGTNKQLLSVSFGSPSVGYISGVDSVLLKTTDGGHTWAPLSLSGINFTQAQHDIIHVNFINDTLGYAVLSNFDNPLYLGELYKTTNGGSVWSPVTTGNIAVYSTFFFDAQNGYEVGSAFFSGHTLMQLSNGTWGNYQTFNFSPQDFLYTVDFRSANVGVAGGSGGYTYRTLNGGANWDTVKTNIDSAIRGVRFLSDNVLLAATDDHMAGIIVSTDTGRTWQNEPNTLTFWYPQMKSLVRSSTDSFIVVGVTSAGDQGMIMSMHGGFAHSESAEQPLNCITMSNDPIAFAVGDSGLIISNIDQVTSVNNAMNDEHQTLVYPNPAKGYVITASAMPYTITITDINGRIIRQEKTLDVMHTISMKTMANGVYLVQFRFEDGSTLQRKLVKEE